MIYGHTPSESASAAQVNAAETEVLFVTGPPCLSEALCYRPAGLAALNSLPGANSALHF